MMGKVFKKYYGKCFDQPGSYRRNGESIKLLKHSGETVKDASGADVVDINNRLRKDMYTAWLNQTTIPHYGLLWRDRGVYRK